MKPARRIAALALAAALSFTMASMTAAPAHADTTWGPVSIAR